MSLLGFSRLMRPFTPQRLIGIDAGSAAIKVVELAYRDEQLWLESCMLADARNASTWAPLKQFLDKATASSALIATGLASPELIVRAAHFPPMPQRELENAIQLEAEQAILNGHKPSDMAIDWHPFTQAQSDGMRGLIAVVPKEIVSAKIQSLAAVGVRPAVVDVDGLALWNAYWSLASSTQQAAKTVLLANIGATKTNLVIVKGRDQLILVRDFEVGLSAVESGRGDEWAEELHDSLAYARTKDGLRSLDAAYLTGAGYDRGMLAIAKKALPASVNYWNPLDHIARSPNCPPVEHASGPLFAVALGLALRGG